MTSSWSLEAYCALEQSRVARLEEERLPFLSESSQHFLQRLNLSLVHPFCMKSDNNNTVLFPAPNVPPMGPLLVSSSSSTSVLEDWVTIWFQTAPSLLALSELWLRLFASVLAPLCVAHLLWNYIHYHCHHHRRHSNVTIGNQNGHSGNNDDDDDDDDDDDQKNGHGNHKDSQNNGSSNQNGNSHQGIANGNNRSSPLPPAPTTTNESPYSYSYLALWSILGVASSVVLTTDTLYVLQFGPQFGVTWLILSTFLAIAVMVVLPTNGSSSSSKQHGHLHHHSRSSVDRTIRVVTLGSILLLWALTIHLLTKHHYDHSLQQDPGATIPWLSFGNAHDAVLIEEGLYHDTTNPMSSKIAKHIMALSSVSSSTTSSSSSLLDYAKHATSWMPTGDSRTGLPFILNVGVTPAPAWIRVWLPVPSAPPVIHNKNTSFQQQDAHHHDDELEEYVALDIAFPPSGGFDPSQPVYLLLHGLNGGSEEEFVKDFTNRRTDPTVENATVAVMVARGLMDLPVRGWNVFHGARTSDVHEAALALQRVITSDDPSTTTTSNTVLAGVGYSMGAIILSNYVARYGKECPLQAAVAISGGLDIRQVVTFYRAQRLWQPMITSTLRHQFVMDKWGERVRARLTPEQMIHMMRSTHITEIDETAVVAYNGFDDLMHYYSEMSLLGDIPLDDYYNETLLATNSVGVGARVHNVSIPLLVIHALDDPLITWRTVAANRGFLHPATLTKTGTGNLFLLLTQAGGHVGWPMGWNPRANGWKWMNNVAKEFIQAVIVDETLSSASGTVSDVDVASTSMD